MAGLNRLLQQNRHKADISSMLRFSFPAPSYGILRTMRLAI